MLTAIKRIRFTVVNPKIVHKKNDIRSDQRLSFYPIVGFKQVKTGAMTLNKPENNNNMTRECADELFRFLTSYQHDHTVENVWIENKGPAFSGGADLEQLRNNELYLDKLMRLAIMVGQFNKPVFAKVHGSVRGIAAYLLTMFSTPIGTQRTTMRLDQTSKGFVPIFGGSYRLSRLPCNIGLYLALTGDKLNAQEMGKLGFLKGYVDDHQCTNKQIRKHISDANLYHRYNYTPSSFGSSQIRRQNLTLYKMNYFYDLISQTQKQIFKSQQNIYSKLALNQYRVAQTEYYNTLNPYNSFTPTDTKLINYFQIKHDIAFNYLKQKHIFEQARTQYHLLARLPLHKLIKVFNHDNMSAVMEELAKDNSDWARKTEEMIREKDPLALHLTFHLIKKAKKLTFVQSLQQQYKVARRLLEQSEIKTKQITKGRNIQILTNKQSSSKIQEISDQDVKQFFRPYQTQSQIFDHDTPKHSLLPTSDYWRKVPDAGRNYLNETFFQDYHSKYGQIEVRRFLNSWKINYKDRSFNIPVLRKYINMKFHYEKLIDLQKQRLRGILQSQIFYSNLKQERIKYVQQRTKDPQFNKLIQKQIANYFQEKFMNRFEDLQKTAKIAGKQQRMSTIRKYVNTLIQNIVYKGRQIQDKIRQSNVRHGGVVRFDDKGSDVFHAETAYQKTIAQFNLLKQAYKDGKNVQKISKMDPNKPKRQNQFFQPVLTNRQHDLIKKDAALRLNYNKTILPQQVALKYKQLIDKASKTSQQIAQLMSWQIPDIQSMLLNAPSQDITFRNFSQTVLERAPQVEQRIQKLNKLYASLQQSKALKFKDVFKTQKQSHNNLFFDTKIIPRAFRSAHIKILDQVLQYFTQQYKINGQIHTPIKQSKNNYLNNLTKQAFNTNFTKLMKNDVGYVFTYMVIIHLKQILSSIQKQRLKQIEQISKYIKQRYDIKIEGLTYNQFNSIFMDYLYIVLDLHQECKHRIIFPHTKMLEFIKRLKMAKQLQNPTQTYSFQSLVYLIAKDRKRLHDHSNNIVPLLGYDPELTLNTLATEQKQNNTGSPNYKQLLGDTQQQILQMVSLLPLYTMQQFTNNKQIHTKNNKNLILGFVYYLRRFQAMVQKVAGKTMFLPKQLYQCKQKQTYKNIRKLLRIQLNNQNWFKQKLKSAITHVFEFRYQQQKNMTQGQLQLFDQQFNQLFTPQMITLLMKYQTYTEQSIAKIMLNADIDQNATNQNIKSYYLDIKSQIKNPKALKMLNNLIMAQNVLNQRVEQLQQMRDIRDQSLAATTEQIRDLQYRKTRFINRRTFERLGAQAFRFPDDDPHAITKPQFYQKNVLRFVDHRDRKPTRFLQELKQIKQLLGDKDLKSQLDNRIRRIQALRQ